MLPDVLPGLHGILQRIGLGGVLLGLHQQPALVAGVREHLEHGVEVHAAVAGDGEGAVADGLQEGPVVLPGLFHHRQTHILQMDVAHPAHILLQHGQGILAGEGEVTGVIAQEHIPGIGVAHHAVRLLAGLDHGAHVVVEAQLEAPVRGDLAQLVQAVAEAVPLGVIHHVLVAAGEDGHVHLALDGVALLADVDAVGAHGSQEVQIGDEVLLLLLEGTGQDEGGVPAAGDAHAPQIQRLFQLGGVLGILVADLTAGEARQGHLADGLLEGVLAAQLRHVVVAPADGCDAQEHVILIKHCEFPLVLIVGFSTGPP